jgi:hypothetical protein
MIAHTGDSNDLDYLTGLADPGVLLGMGRFGLDLFNPGAERVRIVAGLATRGVPVPLFQETGGDSQLLLAMYVGGTAVPVPTFDVGVFLRGIEEERIDTMITVLAAFADIDISLHPLGLVWRCADDPELVVLLAKAFPEAARQRSLGGSRASVEIGRARCVWALAVRVSRDGRGQLRRAPFL